MHALLRAQGPSIWQAPAMVITRATAGGDYLRSVLFAGAIDIDVFTVDTFQNVNVAAIASGLGEVFVSNVTYRQLGPLYPNKFNAFQSSVPPLSVPPYFSVLAMPWANASLVSQVQVLRAIFFALAPTHTGARFLRPLQLCVPSANFRFRFGGTRASLYSLAGRAAPRPFRRPFRFWGEPLHVRPSLRKFGHLEHV